jgi:hypothetical protein
MKITISGWSADVERLVNRVVCLVEGMISGHAKGDADGAG